MGLIRPEVSSLLRNAGITRNGIHALAAPNENGNVSDKLDAAGLSIEFCFDSLRAIIEGGDSDTVKLNSIKTALEAHKVMKGDTPAGTVVNIIIQDPENANIAVNPILIPRQLTQ
jgi:hypothetical protein